MIRSLLLVMVILLSGCSGMEESKLEVENARDAALLQGVPTVLADNLQVPWSIQKAENRFYISERLGAIVKVEAGKVERQPVRLEKPLSEEAEAGLLGFVLHPDFLHNQLAFAYYTYDEQGQPFNRVIVLELQDGIWHESKVLLDRIPSGPVHHGGRMKVGPDEKLYFSAGDAATPDHAQSLDTLNGKILRMNLDGSIPKDNPLLESYIYSYGHRNPQGLAWDEKGTMYESEHGQTAHDELNRIVAGANYGWPVIQGSEQQQGMMAPIFHTGDVTWAPSGMAYWNGKLYVATLRGQALQEVDLATMITREIVTGLGRIRDVFSDGEYLYFVSNNTDGRGNPSKNDDKLYQILLKDVR
jgi:glucose/arabinose dehydrogenase